MLVFQLRIGQTDIPLESAAEPGAAKYNGSD